ncbi:MULTISPECIES: hypothetical protein [Streptomyces]|uniref:Uncharacterized protein n=1 Tax=Streptomyces achmelvichensis TaxID=3134111 RepID=A0ACC6PP50_9ACTN|nr:hypothetical protein OG317_03780 [Streptomyces sp. NBC_01167]
MLGGRTGPVSGRLRLAGGELTEWLPRLTDMSRRAEQLRVPFNTCCDDAAVRDAESIERLLAGAS